MYSKSRLQIIIVISLLLCSSFVYGIDLKVVRPDSIPKGAVVNEGGDHHFMQGLVIGFDGGGTWSENNSVQITLPSTEDVTVADPDGDGTYSDGVSISWTSSTSIVIYSFYSRC